MKYCIGEKIHKIYKEFIVALPENPDELIKVSMVPVLCIQGTFYYNDNTMEDRDDYETLKKALTSEWARTHIIGYEDGMKLLPVNAFCYEHLGFKGEDKANTRLQDKLSQMTRKQFYQSKW